MNEGTVIGCPGCGVGPEPHGPDCPAKKPEQELWVPFHRLEGLPDVDDVAIREGTTTESLQPARCSLCESGQLHVHSFFRLP